MDMVLIVLVVVLIVVLVVSMYVMGQKLKNVTDQNAVHLIKDDLTELARSVGKLNESMGQKIDKNNLAMASTVGKQLSESREIVKDISEKLSKFEATNRHVGDVAQELKTLQNTLSNPKQRGVFGEFYLESVLENVLPTGQYQMQYKFKDGEIVDAVMFLDKGKILPIDSKFSLENYNRMIEASGDERKVLLNKVKADLKGRIDETSKYIRPSEGTMDFAFMFIPSESLYYDLLVSNVGVGGTSRDLIEYAFRDKKVIIVSPTSFMAYLQTVLQGLRSLQIEQQAKEIQERVAKLGTHITKFDEYMLKLGNSLSTTVNHYNSAHKEIEKIDKDVVKIGGGEQTIEPKTLDKPLL